MTFREKLQKEHPQFINEIYDGGCQGCPITYGYEDETPCAVEAFNCTACWDREIPGTEAQNKVKTLADIYPTLDSGPGGTEAQKGASVNPAPEAQNGETVNPAPKRRPVAYISGPITGIANYWEAFEKAEDELSAAGFIPLSPARLPQGMTEAQYMTINLAMLNSADAVYFLPRYEYSKGAMVEYRYASYIGKPNSGDIDELKEVFGL